MEEGGKVGVIASYGRVRGCKRMMEVRSRLDGKKERKKEGRREFAWVVRAAMEEE